MSGSTAAKAKHDLDKNRVAQCLAERIDGFAGPLDIERLQGGQSNPTYLLTTPGARYVLRRKPSGKLLPSAHAVDREHRIMSALAATNVPVPRTFFYSDDASVVGTPFFVMEFIEGRLFAGPELVGLSDTERRGVYESAIDLLASLHRIDYAAVGLADYGRPGDYYARQIRRWTQQYEQAGETPLDAMTNLIKWLPENIPASDETTIVHGDFRINNFIVHPREPRIVGLLDWELSTLGHPLADLAYSCLLYHLRRDLNGLADADTAALGIPPENEIVARYCRRTGRNGIPNWHFYVAFALFRTAAILFGIAARARDGTASHPGAEAEGRLAGPTAEIGWRLVERHRRSGEGILS